MTKYEYRWDDDGERIECDCCEYPAPVAQIEINVLPRTPERRTVWLCEVCSCTHLSKVLSYPRQLTDPLLYRSLGWIANRLLDTIRHKEESGN